MKPIIAINYDALQGMEIGFSNSLGVAGCVIRGVINGAGKVFDRSIPNHALFITENHGQFFATEETLINGLVENSLEPYRRTWNRLIQVWRWEGFESPVRRESALRHLAEIRRRKQEDSRYDFMGLVPFVKLLSKLFPWIKHDKQKQFCSENVFNVLTRYGWSDYPPMWNVQPPDPFNLAQQFGRVRGFRDITSEVIRKC